MSKNEICLECHGKPKNAFKKIRPKLPLPRWRAGGGGGGVIATTAVRGTQSRFELPRCPYPIKLQNAARKESNKKVVCSHLQDLQIYCVSLNGKPFDGGKT